MIHDPDFDPPGKPPEPGPDLNAVAWSALEWAYLAIFTFWVPMLGQLAASVGLVRGIRGWAGPNRLEAGRAIVYSMFAIFLQLTLVALFVHAYGLAART